MAIKAPNKYKGIVAPPPPVPPAPIEEDLFNEPINDSLEGIGEDTVVVAEVVTYATEGAPMPAEMALMKSAAPEDEFTRFLERPRCHLEQARTLTISRTDSIDVQRQKITQADNLLTIFRGARLSAEHYHKDKTGEMTRWKQKMDKGRAMVLELCSDVEKHLKEILKFPELEEARIEDENRAYRVKALTPYLNGAIAVDLGKISEVEFQVLLTETKELWEFRQAKQKEADERARIAEEARQKAEADRLAEVKRKADEDAAQAAAEAEARKAEIAKLKADADAAQAKRDAELKKLRDDQAERDRIAAQERKAMEDRSRRELAAQAERHKLEAQRQYSVTIAERAAAAEENRRIREAAEEQQRIAEEERKKAEAAQREAQRIKDEAAAAAKAKAEAERIAAAAPDVDKLRIFATTIRGLSVPELPANPATAQLLADKTAAFSRWVLTLASNIEKGIPNG